MARQSGPNNAQCATKKCSRIKSSCPRRRVWAKLSGSIGALCGRTRGILLLGRPSRIQPTLTGTLSLSLRVPGSRASVMLSTRQIAPKPTTIKNSRLVTRTATEIAEPQTAIVAATCHVGSTYGTIRARRSSTARRSSIGSRTPTYSITRAPRPSCPASTSMTGGQSLADSPIRFLIWPTTWACPLVSRRRSRGPTWQTWPSSTTSCSSGACSRGSSSGTDSPTRKPRMAAAPGPSLRRGARVRRRSAGSARRTAPSRLAS
mmetsp:Transcript_73529/g.191935  ORF Transcript_73529/g.191935 Transcript_73529/m.191935 type:complete len:261 (-) Transcript_73529:583-1365(-)